MNKPKVWTPGNSVVSKDWSRKTTADFQNFDAIVFSDLHQNAIGAWEQIQDPIVWAGAIANAGIWSLAVAGNVIIFGGDPEAHAGSQCGCGGNFPLPGAQELIENSVRFAAAAGHGLYLPLSAVDPDIPSPVTPTKKSVEHLLSGLGSFSVTHASADRVRKLYQAPAFANTTEAELSDWGQSAHVGFMGWPSGYLPLALVTDVGPESRTPSTLLPAGESGLVHILAKGPSLRLFYLTPPYSGRAVGTSDSFTAYFKDGNGSGISGKTVGYSLPTDSANFPKSGSGSTASDGSVVFNPAYTGANAGTDIVTATVTDTDGTIYTATRKVDWAINIITISSSVDPNAAEPATLGGAANTGTFTISRTGSIASALDVNLTYKGTATLSGDYNASTIATIASGQSSTTVIVTPLFDGISEVTETVVAQIADPDTPGSYAIGNPSEATVSITSSTTDTITLTVIDSLVDETGDNPALLKLHRAGTSGDAFVSLQFSGVASFGDDYIIEGLEADNTAKIPAGQQDFFMYIDPVPDTRSEGTSESVTITILPSPTGSYAVGSPSTQTVNILDDDVDQIPSQGWKLTDLGTFGGANANAFAINTIPLGGGQFRGQVAGFQINSTGPAWKGVLWDNGTYTFRNTYSSFPSVPAQGYYPWSQAWGLNDAGTVVGQCGYYTPTASYHQFASYWDPSSSSPTLLPVLYTDSGLDNYAYAINQRDYINDTGGIIVGAQRTIGGNVHAVMWIPDANETYPSSGLNELFDIGNGTRNSIAYAINQFGEVVGDSQAGSSTVYHAFRSRSQDGIPVVLDSFFDDMGTATFTDGHTSEANDINSIYINSQDGFGELVGASQFPGNLYHAAYKAPLTGKNLGWYRLGVLGEGTANAGTQSVACGINSNGLIVGRSQVKVNNVMVWHGFVVSNQGNPGSQPLLDLNDYAYVLVGSTWFTAAQNGWKITNAEKINGGNWIVGFGTKSGVTRAFVLSPR